MDNAAVADLCLPREVYQAEGVLSARLDVSVAEAATVLRKVAQCAGTPLVAVARHVLAGPETGI